MDDNSLVQDMFTQLTLGVLKSLEKRPGICDIQLVDKNPVERHQLVSWEQQNSCMLPEDLKRFYLTSDGLLLKWSVRFEDQTQPVGHMEINKVDNLTKLAGNKAPTNMNMHSLADLDYESDVEDKDGGDDSYPSKPHFDTRSRMFELDPCGGIAKVCLVYKNTKPGVPAQFPELWLLDRALRWHFLAHTFSQYFRLMLMHLGLPQWQYAFTDIGLPPQAKHWFNIYSPLRIRINTGGGLTLHDAGTTDGLAVNKTVSQTNQVSTGEVNRLDVGRVFKGKTDKKSKSSQHKKKNGPSSKLLSGSASASRSGSQPTCTRLR